MSLDRGMPSTGERPRLNGGCRARRLFRLCGTGVLSNRRSSSSAQTNTASPTSYVGDGQSTSTSNALIRRKGNS
jgi:hypothetical protein